LVKKYVEDARDCESELPKIYFGLEKQKDAPDMIFVRTWRHGRYVPYIPGSSLKGVFRAQAEKIAAIFTDKAICRTHDNPRLRQANWPSPCSERLKSLPNNKHPYSASCPICRLFGNLKLKGRIFFSDAYSPDYQNRELVPDTNNVKLPVRDGVAIDRFKGGVKRGALYNYEVEETAKFDFTITVQNFEIWQLGLLAFLLADLEDGLITIGAGRSKGMGRESSEIQSLEICYWQAPGSDVLLGIGGLVDDPDFHKQFDIKPQEMAVSGEEIVIPVQPLERRRLPVTYMVTEKPQLMEILAQAADYWVNFMKDWTPPWEGPHEPKEPEPEPEPEAVG